MGTTDEGNTSTDLVQWKVVRWTENKVLRDRE